MHDGAAGVKELVWLDCARHIDLYDVEPYVGQAVAATGDFLRRAWGQEGRSPTEVRGDDGSAQPSSPTSPETQS